LLHRTGKLAAKLQGACLVAAHVHLQPVFVLHSTTSHSGLPTQARIQANEHAIYTYVL